MKKKTCVVIGLIVIAFWAYCACLNAYEARWWVRGEEIASAVLMTLSAILMLIACVKIFSDDVKPTTVL